ncbi:MAG: phosphate acyltransferase PlsX [Blastocatellia bacterium]
MLTTIAVDAMGGDNAPAVEVEGALQAARDLRTKIILVGQEEKIRAELVRIGIPYPREKRLHIEIVHASEVITMDDPVATSVRRKRDSSIRVAARLVREGKAHGLVSAGNTGAVMATTKLVLGTLPSIDRPALAGIFPTLKGRGTVLLDVGANAECKPIHLKQFAIMGAIYSRSILGVRSPRVGLMSIGEEDMKGTELIKEAALLLREAPINFCGNVEGRDIFTGDIDVIVSDGFTGNVILKTSEGLVEAIMSLLKTELGQTVVTQLGGMLSLNAFRSVKKRLDYSEFGGAPLLGCKQISIICHGSSNVKAIRNAIRVAKEFHQAQLNERIEADVNLLETTKNL